MHGKDRLAVTLAILRQRARMSQRELSRLSKISYTQISDLERTEGGNPSPLTLRALARGLASDNFAAAGYDAVRADAFYRQLMDAAGYLSGLSPDEPPAPEAPAPTEGAVADFLADLAGDPSLAADMVRVARRYPDLPPDGQAAVRYLLRTWAGRA